MAVEFWSANHVRAPPAATFAAPSVHDFPAGTVGAEVALAERPRQSLSGVEVQGMFFASSSFWLARNVAVDVWLPLWTAAVEYGMTLRSVTNAIVMIIAASMTSTSVKPAAGAFELTRSRRTLRLENMCEMVCNVGASPQEGNERMELRSFRARREGSGGQFRTTTSDNKQAAWPSCPVKRSGQVEEQRLRRFDPLDLQRLRALDGSPIAGRERVAVERQRAARNLEPAAPPTGQRVGDALLRRQHRRVDRRILVDRHRAVASVGRDDQPQSAARVGV